MKVSCAVLLLLGCGTNGEALLPGELDSVDLAPSPGWPDSVAVRSVRASFRTAITALDVDPAGRVWLLRDEFSNASQRDGTPVLERYAPTGHAGPWVEELRSACERHSSRALDLRGLQTADAGGLLLLRQLASEGRTLLHLSGYLTVLLAPRP